MTAASLYDGGGVTALRASSATPWKACDACRLPLTLRSTAPSEKAPLYALPPVASAPPVSTAEYRGGAPSASGSCARSGGGGGVCGIGLPQLDSSGGGGGGICGGAEAATYLPSSGGGGGGGMCGRAAE